MTFKEWPGASKSLRKTFAGGLWDQNDFHNNTNLLYAFLNLILMNIQWSFSVCMACDVATIECRSGYEKLIPSRKPDIREACKNTKQCHSSHLLFSVWKMHLFFINIYVNMIYIYHFKWINKYIFQNFCFRL